MSLYKVWNLEKFKVLLNFELYLCLKTALARVDVGFTSLSTALSSAFGSLSVSCADAPAESVRISAIAASTFLIVFYSLLFVKVKLLKLRLSAVGLKEIHHIATVFLGGAAQTCGTLHESAYAVHLKQLVLVWCGEVLHHLGH